MAKETKPKIKQTKCGQNQGQNAPMCIVAVHISGHTHIHRKKEEKRDLMQTKALGERTRTIINTTCGIAQKSQILSESATEKNGGENISSGLLMVEIVNSLWNHTL